MTDCSPSNAAPRPLVDAIDAALPQTQCTRCGYPDCRSYAHAVAQGEAAINRCPPGGAEGIQRLARLTGLPELPLDPACGPEAPRRLAVIEEAGCIGCTLCLKACPVDAIVGGPKLMHTVIEAECTGCALCLPACPVDCIAMEDSGSDATGWAAWSAAQAGRARARHDFHRLRLERDQQVREQRLAARRAPPVPPHMTASTRPFSTPSTVSTAPAPAAEHGAPAADPRRTVIEAALARARAARKEPLA